jgi:aspartokinase
MRNNPIIVQKYGGACLETPAKIRAVASSLADLHSRGHRVVAIVSAMGKTTDELVKMTPDLSDRLLIAEHARRKTITIGGRPSMEGWTAAYHAAGIRPGAARQTAQRL